MRRFLLCFLLAFPFGAFSAVQLKCIAVGSAGDVTITWQNTASSALFRSYHIYHSTNSSGPYALIDSVNSYPVQTYFDVAANANILDAYYYVELDNTNGTTTLSDTIRAMQLSVIDPGVGYASLLWNSTHTPPIATNSQYHLIFREYPAGVFTLIDSVDITIASLTYLDEISICGDTVKYRIEVHDASGCTSVSSVDGDYFIDQISPEAPHIDSVSVDVNGNAQIGWTQSSSNDTYAYIIYQTDGTTTVPIDTVYGSGTTFYQSAVNALAGTQGFRLVAIDSCGNPCAADPLQQTIFLEASVDRCSASALLNWNPYVNAPSNPLYQILMSENGGGDIIVGSTSSTGFTVNGLKTDSLYCFKVLADLNGTLATSTSNPVCVSPDLPVAPQYSYIRSVSVFPNDVVTVTAYVDPLADVKEYHLERSHSANGVFASVASQPFAGISTVIFTDEVATDEVLYYRVATIDSCGNDVLPSQVSCTISIDTLSSLNYVNSLRWNNYRTWNGGIYQYRLYRSLGGIYDASPLSVIIPFDSLYADDVSDEYATEGEFCYYIMALEGPGNPYGFADSVRSNEICIRQNSSVYIPNAFRPGGVNDVFNPAEAFIGMEGYTLEIYDRFGELIFETHDPSQGWNGNAQTHRCDMGVYVYRLTARNEKGIEIEKVGRVSLIR